MQGVAKIEFDDDLAIPEWIGQSAQSSLTATCQRTGQNLAELIQDALARPSQLLDTLSTYLLLGSGSLLTPFPPSAGTGVLRLRAMRQIRRR